MRKLAMALIWIRQPSCPNRMLSRLRRSGHVEESHQSTFPVLSLSLSLNTFDCPIHERLGT